jgi:hypothetical protein
MRCRFVLYSVHTSWLLVLEANRNLLLPPQEPARVANAWRTRPTEGRGGQSLLGLKVQLAACLSEGAGSTCPQGRAGQIVSACRLGTGSRSWARRNTRRERDHSCIKH